MTLPGRQVLAVVVAVLAGLVARACPASLPGLDAGRQLRPAAAARPPSPRSAWARCSSATSQLARAREQLVELAVTQERERMARDVHDILGHSLTVITVKAEPAGWLPEQGRPPRGPAAELTDVERLAREALADVRATVGGVPRAVADR